MKKFLLLTLFFYYMQAAFAFDVPITFAKKHNGWMKILSDSKKEFLVSSKGIELIEKNKTVEKLAFAFNCNDATILNENILLATDVGIKVFNTSDDSLKNYLPEISAKKITHVITDELKRVWFSVEFEGCFIIDNNAVFARVTAPVIYSLASTPDSNVWVGTNIGLYKVSLKEDKVFRYAEEGIEGLELPDNLVERLFTDNKSNVWVLMPEQVAFIPGKDFEGELPVYNHIGTKNNAIYSICDLPQSSSAYLFATAEGIIYTSNIKEDAFNHTGEIHQQINQTAFLITDAVIERPSEFKNERVLLIQKFDKHTWFITENGLWKIKTGKFIQTLKKHYS